MGTSRLYARILHKITTSRPWTFLKRHLSLVNCWHGHGLKQSISIHGRLFAWIAIKLSALLLCFGDLAYKLVLCSVSPLSKSWYTNRTDTTSSSWLKLSILITNSRHKVVPGWHTTRLVFIDIHLFLISHHISICKLCIQLHLWLIWYKSDVVVLLLSD